MKGKRILMVDDEENTIAGLRRRLRETGAIVQCASNLDDALNAIDTTEPEYVIVDLRMVVDLPERLTEHCVNLDNYEVLGLSLVSWLRAEHPKIHCCVYSIVPGVARPILDKMGIAGVPVFDKLDSIDVVFNALQEVFNS